MEDRAESIIIARFTFKYDLVFKKWTQRIIDLFYFRRESLNSDKR